MTAILLARHGRAFVADPWYRRAWLFGPQAAALLTIGWLFTSEPPPSLPVIEGPWAHPIRNPAAAAALAGLRDRARTDPTARELLLTRAKAGEAGAQFYMATLSDPMLNPAAATEERTRDALEWYRKAAAQNLPAAMTNLGNLISSNRFGVEPDYPQAFTLLEQAAPAVPAAQRQLGLLYRDGRGVPADVDKGMDLIRKAADRGDPLAEFNLALAVDKGQFGLTPDHQQAVLLFQRAAERNVIPAERELGLHLRAGDGVAADPVRANFWFKKAADAGDGFSRAQLAASPGATGVTPSPPTERRKSPQMIVTDPS